MDVDELLQQAREARFPLAWDGCLIWASGLVSWHLAQRPLTWAPLQELQDQAQMYIHHVGAVVACALYTTAVDQGLDAPDGADLLRIPLALAAGLLGDGVFDVLTAAAPPHQGLASLLHSIPVWIDAGDDAARGKGQFVIEQARDVLAVHSEFGYAVGDRLRAVLEQNQALDDLQQATMGVTVPQVFDAQVYERAQPIQSDLMAIANLEAMLLADKASGVTNPALIRQHLLLRAVIADRMTLGLGERASVDALARAEDFARALLDFDLEHRTRAGAAPAGDPRWSQSALGFVRQEYGVHLDRMSRPLLGD